MAKYRGSVLVNVDIEDIISDIDDKTLKDIYAERFGSEDYSVSLDLLSEIERSLYAGRINDALALIVAEQVARGTPETTRLAQYRQLHGTA